MNDIPSLHWLLEHRQGFENPPNWFCGFGNVEDWDQEAEEPQKKITEVVVMGCQCCCWQPPPHASAECPTADALGTSGCVRTGRPFACPRNTSSSGTAAVGKDLHQPASGLALFFPWSC